MPRVYRWASLADDFGDCLILGNGASVAVSERFGYRSLYENAIDRALITKRAQKVFDHFQTVDYEMILRMLWHAQHVNTALGVQETTCENAYRKVRDALIRVLRDVPPAWSACQPSIAAAGRFMKTFRTVLSLNYDLLVYWAMLEANNELGTWFKDCFVDGVFDSEWTRFRQPFQAPGSTLVFYPHGSLFLATDIHDNEVKLQSDQPGNLLESVFSHWSTAQYAPIFVSEGTAEQKARAIDRSRYLTCVRESVIKAIGPRITIFGWAMNDVDDHIVQALCAIPAVEFAISIHRPSVDIDAFCGPIIAKLRRLTGRSDVPVKFFDAESQGCWIHA
jgi:hypothetical protein